MLVEFEFELHIEAWQWTGSPLSQAIYKLLVDCTAPSHCFNQRWLTVSVWAKYYLFLSRNLFKKYLSNVIQIPASMCPLVRPLMSTHVKYFFRILLCEVRFNGVALGTTCVDLGHHEAAEMTGSIADDVLLEVTFEHCGVKEQDILPA